MIKIGIDKKTEPTYFNIVLEDNKEYFKYLRKQADEDGQNELTDETIKISLTNDKHSFETEEYYYDNKDSTIIYSGKMSSIKGESFVSFSIHLSDEVLIDILQHSIKRLNKFKTALETLK